MKKKIHIFRSSNWEKKSPKALIFNCDNINVALLWLILKRDTILEDFFLLDSVRYRDDVITTLKFDWSDLKILMLGWYRKLTSSCVYLQYISNVIAISTVMSFQYRYNIRDKKSNHTISTIKLNFVKNTSSTLILAILTFEISKAIYLFIVNVFQMYNLRC